MELKNEISPKKTMTPPNLDDFMKKVKAIAQGQNCDLLFKFVDILYNQEYPEEEIFSLDDLTDIRAGVDEIRQGHTVSWNEFKKEHNL